MDTKVISWCFFVNLENISRLGEYLVGLKCNQRAARWWFPGWQCRLYYDAKGLSCFQIIKTYIENICNNGTPAIEMLPVREGYPSINERYRPLFDPNVSVCIVRDIDSILSKPDADRVNDWLNNSTCKVLKYREHYMRPDYVMGGGICVKGHFLNEQKYIKPCSAKKGDDERMLCNLLKDSEPAIQTMVTRMTESGIYYIFDGNKFKPPCCQELLWLIPFYDVTAGFAEYYRDDQLHMKNPESITEIVEFSKKFPIKRELIGHHWFHHKTTIDNTKLDTNEEWIR